LDLKQEAIRGVKWTSLSTGLSFILGLIQIAIIARYLPASEIGLLSLITIIIGISRVFSDAGISNSIIHFQDLNQQQINTLYWLNVVLSCVAALTLYLLAPFITLLFPKADLSNYLRLVCIAIPLAAVGQQFLILLKRDLAFQLISYVEMVVRVTIFLVIVILLVYFDFDLMAVLYATVAGAAVSGVVYLVIGMRIYFIPSISTFNISNCRHCLSFGLFQMGDRVVSYASANLDKIIIGRFFGTTILGFYELATILISRPITIINPIFNTVSFPLFSKMQHDLPRLNDWYIKKIAIISLLTAPIFCGMYAIRHDLVEFIYGTGKEITIMTLGIICLLGYFRSISNPLGTYVLALGKPDHSLYLNLFQLAVHGLLLFIGVSYLSFESMLWLYVAGSICITIPAAYYLRHRLSKMSVMAHFSVILKNLMMGIIMIICLTFIQLFIARIDMDLMMRIIVMIISGVLIYLIVNFIFNRSLVKDLRGLIHR